MKAITFIFALCFSILIPLSSLAKNRGMAVEVEAATKAGLNAYDPSRFHALVIGIDKYKHWPTLRCAGNDGKSMAEVLQKNYGFKHVKFLHNEQATRESILEALDSYLALGEEDSLLIYYAGHGWMDPNVQTGYWVPSEARKEKKFDYIANSRIVEDYFKKYKVKHLLVIADSCFSGTLLRGMGVTRDKEWKLPVGFKKPSRWVMTSGDLAPVPDDSGVGHSPFASRVLQYLKHSDSKAFGIQDLYLYVRKNLESEAIAQPMQTPSHMPGGEFVFCRLTVPIDITLTIHEPSLEIHRANQADVKPRKDVERFYLTSRTGIFKKSSYSAMKSRFESRANNTVYDKRLEKTWHILDSKQIYDRKKAIEACSGMDGNCRLPTIQELASLITQRKLQGDWGHVNSIFFPKHSRTTKFWSSTQDRINGCSYVDFSRGVSDTGSSGDYLGVIAISDK